MKRILATFIVVLAIFFLGAQNYEEIVYYSVCEEPVRYRIGDIDPQFSVKNEELRALSENAAKIWNSEWEKDLLVYDPLAKLSVNLVYDERQELTTEINSTKIDLEENSKVIENQINNYESQLLRLESQIEDLNEKIAYWNNNGGAPEDVYKDLLNEQDRLRSEIARVNAEATELNNKATTYNENVDDFNKNINDFNELLDEKPEEGLYIPAENKIEIYIVNNKETLTHTIAHEFGHALGIEHVQDPKSLMYTTVSNAVELSGKDKEALAEVCEPRNRIKDIFLRYAR